MIKLEKTQVVGWEPTIRGMRNPMNSWEKSDTVFTTDEDHYDICGNSGPIPESMEPMSMELGSSDKDLMMRLASAGSVDAKYRRMIVVYVDITAPFYWWKEFDTYKVGTVANSCSTMHKIHAKPFELDDFSHEHLDTDWVTIMEDGKDYPYYFESADQQFCESYLDVLRTTIEALNRARDKFLATKDKRFWWQMIQLLPTSYNQRRTVMLNYEVLAGIYPKRKNHKLDEWHDFCDWIKTLPYSEIITLKEDVLG